MSFYSCGKHTSISPAENASAGWCAGGSPSSGTGSSAAWCRSHTTALSAGGACCSPPLPRPAPAWLLVLSITLPASVPDKGVLGEGSACSLGSQPYSGGDPSALCTQVRALAGAKEENAIAAGAVHVSSHPSSSSWARFWQQLLIEASPAVLLHWDLQAVITGCAMSWSFPLAISATYTFSNAPISPPVRVFHCVRNPTNSRWACLLAASSRVRKGVTDEGKCQRQEPSPQLRHE